jgi:GDPmannose 4,6-dehydratase
MQKTALVTGVTGQDGAYLSQLLLKRGYRVVGTQRSYSANKRGRLAYLGVADHIEYVEMDLLQLSSVLRVIEDVRPDEVYNLAAQSFVGRSFEQPIYTADIDALSVTRLLEAIRIVNPKIKFYQASTSELFGNATQAPQTEDTPFSPRNPYGVAKLYAHWITMTYRNTYGIHASSGILYNHESPIRGMDFVTRKITSQLALIKRGRQKQLTLGNLNAKRDWGFAGDYVEGMWRMLQENTPGSYVLATGECHSVREFAQIAAGELGFDIVWEGKGVNECGIDRKTGSVIISIDSEFYRPADTKTLVGSPKKAEESLGWRRHVSFNDLVCMMAHEDDKHACDLVHAF